MNVKSFLLTVATVFAASSVFAQANILNAKSPDEIGVRTETQKAVDNDKPLEYGYVDDRDILFSKMTWEKVVLDERANFPLYYPIDTNNIGSDRRSGEALSAEYINTRDITAADIREYHIKGLWYFDKRQAEMKYRLLGIAPVAPDVNFIDDSQPDLVPLFWVFFPDAREVLHEAKSFNNSNSSMPFSFDHVLNARRFQGYIFREENVQGDRAISEYVSENALMQLLESERIKDKIRDFELDMWTY